MDIAFAVGKGVLAWLAFMFIGTNLIGFAITPLGLRVNTTTDDADPVIQKYVQQQKSSRAMVWAIGVAFWVLIAIYLTGVFRWFGPLATIAAALMMASRAPDVLWEMRNERRITASDHNAGSGLLGTLLTWVSLPLAILSFF